MWRSNNAVVCQKKKSRSSAGQRGYQKDEIEEKVTTSTEKNVYQQSVIKAKKSYLTTKEWNNCTRQQQYNRKKQLGLNLKTALNFCETTGFEPRLVEVKNKNKGTCEVFDINTGTFSDKVTVSSNKVVACSTLYIKDKFSLSDQAYHVLSMITPGLTSSSTVKNLATSMNAKFACPNGVIGVQ